MPGVGTLRLPVSRSTGEVYPRINFSSYLGGSSCDQVTSVARDEQGDIYLAGYTCSLDFPTRNAFIPKLRFKKGVTVHGFVTKVDPTTRRVVFSTYLGGSGDDYIHGVALDADNNVIVVGMTRSRDFPVKNAFMPNMPVPVTNDILPLTSAFVTKLSADGQRLIFSTYLGGTGKEWGAGALAVRVDSKSNVLVAGWNGSKDFPQRHPFAGACKGIEASIGTDDFLTKFTPDGRLVFSGCLGYARLNVALAVDALGNSYVTGSTTDPNLPTTPGVFQPEYGGYNPLIVGDAFVAKVSPAGKLVFLTYFGGRRSGEIGTAIDVDPLGNVYLGGRVWGPELPLLNPIRDWTPTPEAQPFLAKLDPDGAHLLYSTYWGGGGGDDVRSISVSPIGEPCIAGGIESWDFPLYRSLRDPPGADGFVSRFSADGTQVLLSTAIGANGLDWINSVQCTPWGGAIVAGATSSTDLPMVRPFQPKSGGNGLQFTFGEGWVAELSSDPAAQTPSVLNLLAGRFRVEAMWADGAHKRAGFGQPLTVTDRTGAFWFNDASDVSLLVKVVDGRAVNGRFWFFAGGLSDVEYWIRVVDTQTGQERTYHNPAGHMASLADTRAFSEAAQSAPASATKNGSAQETPTCSAGNLCLQQGRFRIAVAWDSAGSPAAGQPASISDSSGYFAFFDPESAEVAVKIIDGRPVNGHFWVFLAGLSTAHYTVTITDTQTGVQKSFEHAAGGLSSSAELTSF